MMTKERAQLRSAAAALLATIDRQAPSITATAGLVIEQASEAVYAELADAPGGK